MRKCSHDRAERGSRPQERGVPGACLGYASVPVRSPVRECAHARRAGGTDRGHAGRIRSGRRRRAERRERRAARRCVRVPRVSRERIIFGWAFRLPTDRLMRWEHLGVPWVARHQQVVNLGRGDADRGGLTRRSVGALARTLPLFTRVKSVQLYTSESSHSTELPPRALREARVVKRRSEEGARS